MQKQENAMRKPGGGQDTTFAFPVPIASYSPK